MVSVTFMFWIGYQIFVLFVLFVLYWLPWYLFCLFCLFCIQILKPFLYNYVCILTFIPPYFRYIYITKIPLRIAFRDNRQQVFCTAIFVTFGGWIHHLATPCCRREYPLCAQQGRARFFTRLLISEYAERGPIRDQLKAKNGMKRKKRDE